MTQPTKIHSQLMNSAISAFIDKLDEYPGWKEWNRNKFGHTLYFDDFIPHDKKADEFFFDKETEKQHAVIMSYLTLHHTSSELRNLELYFRRFPHTRTPITRHDHLSNCCELYFSKFYQYKERIRVLFDAVEAAIGTHNLAIGKFIKKLDKEFDTEMRERHSVHHRQRFEDIEISRVFLIESMIQNNPSLRTKGWPEEQRRVYRKAANAWAQRFVAKSERLDAHTEAVAEALLKVCPFLTPDIGEVA